MASFYFFDTLTSTMDEAHNRAFRGSLEDQVIVAKEQTKGRGRRGRSWESISGNLHLTYLTYSDISLSNAPQLSLVSCVALGQELLTWIPSTEALTYKWPNDLLLNGKKVGGLLLEALPNPELKKTCFLIGFGLNIKSYPQGTRYPATSLEHEGIFLSMDDIMRPLVTSLKSYINKWEEAGFDFIHDIWMKRAAYFNQKISLEVGGKIQEGIFQGINNDGSMLLETSDRTQIIAVGEIL